MGIPASTPTSQGGMKCLVGGSLGLEKDAVNEAEALEGVGELVQNILSDGLLMSFRGVSKSGCSHHDPSIR